MRREKITAVQKIILALLIVNLLAVGGVIVHLSGALSREDVSVLSQGQQEGTCYTLYIGTNDKDTYTQKISLDEARKIVDEICVKYVDGYTMQEASGGWVDETGTLTQEETLVYRFMDVDEDKVISIMDEVLAALNQNSILVEKNEVSYRYYNQS